MKQSRANRATRGRRASLLATLAMTAVAGGVQAAGAAPAGATVAGVTRHVGPLVPSDGRPQTEAQAECPAGKKVIGGGARVTGPAKASIRLTRLVPVSEPGGPDRFEAAAEEPPGGATGVHSLEAYAMCAPANTVPGHTIRALSSAWEAKPIHEAVAGCQDPNDEVLGAGAAIDDNGAGTVHPGLQMARVGAPALDIARARAALVPGSSLGSWRVLAYAICVDRTALDARASSDVQPLRLVHQPCPSERPTLLSVGGATGADADGFPSFLNDLFPEQVPGQSGYRTLLRVAGPLPADGVAVRAICA
ncbi:hypothetical protein DPM19_02955 [Actinomadura craniellae]|uniref:Septum formation-related domain-containing protein n=1 Tax=Actinomadura craniellae TaxID=2231787 RepID=A0A365HDM5_9ACTN|nr:hypothetical protein [Actinomadura craniellae]RAY17132.1 hypothetical protein DPM19_02955 [Actinomadura craniellae]